MIIAAWLLPGCAGTENPGDAAAAVTDVQQRNLDTRAADAKRARNPEESEQAALDRTERRNAASALRDMDRPVLEGAHQSSR